MISPRTGLPRDTSANPADPWPTLLPDADEPSWAGWSAAPPAVAGARDALPPEPCRSALPACAGPLEWPGEAAKRTPRHPPPNRPLAGGTAVATANAAELEQDRARGAQQAAPAPPPQRRAAAHAVS
eukprot:2727294-Alexandrium_andersonii.AAC.3